LKNKDNIRKTCKIFDCKKSTLQRWIKRYKTSKNIKRRNRKSISYKITKPQVNTALELLKQNEQLTMNELVVDHHKKDNDFYEITRNIRNLQKLSPEQIEYIRILPIEKQTELLELYNECIGSIRSLF
jgi:transposase